MSWSARSPTRRARRGGTRRAGEQLDALPTRQDGDAVDGDDEIADPQQPLPRRDPVRRDPPHAVRVVDVEAERALGAARNRDLDYLAAERRVVGAVDGAGEPGVGVDGEARRAGRPGVATTLAHAASSAAPAPPPPRSPACAALTR